jgi:biopolymer transport protein ExbD
VKFLQKRGHHEASVELTPLIDVVFLLLIFFMVSTEPAGELQEVEDDLIEITVDRVGDYAVNDRLLVKNDLRTLVRALEEVLSERPPSSRVIVTADANASHQAVVRAMDAAGKVGLTRLSITTQQPSQE